MIKNLIMPSGNGLFLVYGIILTGFGIFSYEVFPMTIMSDKPDSFIIAVVILLLIVMVALVFFMLNVESIIERTIVYFFLFLEISSIKKLVIKNLIKHRV
jgi:hypothetical protein